MGLMQQLWGHPVVGEERQAMEADFREYLAAPDSRVVVATREERVNGAAFFSYRRNLSTGPFVVIDDLVVDKGSDFEQIGGRLVELIEGAAAGRKCRALELWTGLHRYEAQRFYEKLGFQRAVEFRKVLGGD